MNLACILNLIFPIAGLIGLLLLNPGSASSVTRGYVGWYAVGAALHLAAAAMLLRPTHTAWRRGWPMLWVAAICYLGGYSNLWLQEKDVQNATMLIVQVQGAKQDYDRLMTAGNKSEEAEAARTALEGSIAKLEKLRPGLAADDEHKRALETERGSIVGLQYILSLLFVAGFFSIAAFASLGSQKFYGFETPTEVELPGQAQG